MIFKLYQRKAKRMGKFKFRGVRIASDLTGRVMWREKKLLFFRCYKMTYLSFIPKDTPD